MTASSRALAGAVCIALAGCADPEPPRSASDPVPTFAGRFTPIDDGVELPGFSEFRAAMREAVGDRDTVAIIGFVAPGARLSFGDEPGGPEGFLSMWFSGSPPDGRDPWEVLSGVLHGGSVEEDGAVTAPFAFGMWPDDIDAFSNVAIVGQGVPAYSSPSLDGDLLARISHLIVPVLGPPEDGWRKIRLPDEREAFVRERRALSPIGYRAAFWEDTDGRWRLQTFLAGD